MKMRLLSIKIACVNYTTAAGIWKEINRKKRKITPKIKTGPRKRGLLQVN